MASIQSQIAAINLVLRKLTPKALNLSIDQFKMIEGHLQEGCVSLAEYQVLLSNQQKDKQP